MDWEKLDLHIENLASGMVLLTVLLIGWPLPGWAKLQPEKAALAAMVAIAYMLGAFSDVLARLLLEFVCRMTLRRLTLRLFLGIKTATLNEANKKLSDAIRIGVTCGSERIESEVTHRRQTARLMRLSLLPLLTGWLGFARHFQWHVFSALVVAAGVYAALLVLYSYSEMVIMQECLRGMDHAVERERQRQENLKAKAAAAH